VAAVPSVLIAVSTPLFGLALTGAARDETVSGMTSTPARILVVANRTAAAPRLLKAVEHRAAETPCRFTLLVPDVANARAADWTLDSARPLLAKAAGAPVGGLTGGPDPFTAVKDAVATGDFDEIIISTLPRGVSKWLRRDLVTKVRGLGLPVTSIIPGDRPRPGLADKAMDMTGNAYHSASRGSGHEDS
jgi:hypothetical protein